MQVHHPIPRNASANLYVRPFMLVQEELVLFCVVLMKYLMHVCEFQEEEKTQL